MTSSVEQFGTIPFQAFEPGVFARRVGRPAATVTSDATAKPAERSAPRPEPVDKAARQGKETGRGSGRVGFDALRALQEQEFKERTRAAELTPEDVARRYAETEAGDGPKAPGQLSAEAERRVAELKRTDQEVRAHERAHAAAGGQYAGAPSYSYESGPDGHKYAVAGEVAIDSSPVANDPEATIAKMEQVKAAANAPAEPSAQDRQVAAAAEAERAQAVIELRRQQDEDPEDGSGDGVATDGDAVNGVNAVDGVDQFRLRPPGDIVDLVV
jgi:hypothetical protein